MNNYHAFEVQELCEKLFANDPAFLVAEIDLQWSAQGHYDQVCRSDQSLDQVAEALRKNTTVEEVHIKTGFLPFRAELSLFSALIVHPKLKKLSFRSVEIDDLHTVSRMFRVCDSLAHLVFDYCTMDVGGGLDHISSLVEGGLLESLHIEDCNINSLEVSRLSNALGNNKTLKELFIKVGCEDDEGITMSVVAPGLRRLLRENQKLSKLTLHLFDVNREVPNGSEIMSRVAQAATGHESLQNLTLVFTTQLSEDAAEVIGSMISSSPKLRELALRDVSIGPAALRQLVIGVQGVDTSLEKLDLPYGGIFDDPRKEIESNHLGGLLLGINPSLKSLDLSYRGIGSKGACALAEALKQNHVLKELDLGVNQLGNEGATAIVGALLSNRSMRSIKFLIHNVTGETEATLLRAVERNTNLESVEAYGMSSENTSKLEYQLSLNRGGRRILSSQRDMPLNYWPRVLANSSDNADVLFFFLREKHEILVPRPGARAANRKRKRSEE